MVGETQITIVGGLTADPETRQAGSAQVTSFSVAVGSRKKDGDDWIDGDTTYFRCNAWREIGEHAAATLAKGTRVIVTGRLQQRNWEKDGQKRSALEIEVDEVGPSLRYATARVERVQGNRNQADRAQQARAQGGPSNVQQHQSAYDPNLPF